MHDRATVRLFAYGTLQVPAVLRAVTGRDFVGQPARLDGWTSFLLRGRPYPGAIEEASGAIEGTLFEGLDKHALALIDRFEDRDYERREITVTVEGGARVPSFAYLIPEHRRHLVSRRKWDRARFEGRELRRFLGAPDV